MEYEALIPFIEDILMDIRSETGLLKDIVVSDKNNIMITCPNHKGGQESSPSCGVSLDNGLVNCLSCGWKGNLITLTSKCRRLEEGAWKYLVERYVGSSNVFFRKKAKLSFKREEEKGSLSEQFEDVFKYKKAIEYLEGRGITRDIIQMFNIKYDKKRQMVQIPISYGRKIVGYKGRKITACDKKYRFYNTPNMVKPLFALESIKRGTCVFITEAELDCLTFWVWGQESISILGASITDVQLKQLATSSIKTVVIALDNDSVGKEAAWKLYRDIKHLNIEIYLVLYKDSCKKKDANDFKSLIEYKQNIILKKLKK